MFQVPAEADKWTMAEPFSAKELENGDIVGRGTQDMKCVCIQYLEVRGFVSISFNELMMKCLILGNSRAKEARF